MSAGQSLSRDATSAEHVFIYRNVSYTVWGEVEGIRYWAIFPGDGPVYGARGGYVGATGDRGSFRRAVNAAEAAIDVWLGRHPGV